MSQIRTTRIGRFELLGRLGKGSQGVVFLARDPEIDRSVAIKVLTGSLAAVREEDAPLEAKISGKLAHPNIVTLHEVGRLRAGRYLVFEYVRGESLRAIMEASAPLDPMRALTLAEGIAAGLAHAHERGIAHLDLSPGNVLVDEHGVPRVMDFGLARFAAQPTDSTTVPVGTIRYMAPEHFGGPRPGLPADVFAVALVLFEMLSGRPAWDATSPARVMRQILEEPLDLDSLPDDELSRALRPVIEQATAKSPEARYANAGELRDALREAAGSDTAPGDAPHATVEFLLRRMRLKSDFPALSQSFAEINRLTGHGSNASVKQLSGVVLRDYALANKLLKLANSAFYGHVSGKVSSITQAVRVLGFDRVRIAANGLLFLSTLQGDGRCAALEDALLRAFASGLLTRHLARRLRLADPEEAFLCGLFQNIGETLAIYYFPEEHQAIRELQTIARNRRTVASRAVLGITYEALGRAVGEIWQFPPAILDAIAASDPDFEPTADATYAAVFTTELCALFAEHRLDEMPGLVACFEESQPIGSVAVERMLAAMADKLEEYSAILGVPMRDTAFGAALTGWLSTEDVA